jgi:hypothetical protein
LVLGPFIPSITLTDPNKITSPILESTVYSEIGDEVPGVLGKAMTAMQLGYSNVCQKVCDMGRQNLIILVFG